MKKQLLFMAAAGATLVAANRASAAEPAVVIEETTFATVDNANIKTVYAPASWRDNWYIQFGAGIRSPFVENVSTPTIDHRRMTAIYNLGVGRWISPYLGFRVSAYYGSMHWNQEETASAKTANLNVDFMWDMFNSIHGYNPNRVFSIIPYVGLGGTFVWDYHPVLGNDIDEDQKIKSNQWLLPVSAGLQLRFRVSPYVDIFAEGRGTVYGDNFNNLTSGKPLDIDISAVGGVIVHFTGSKFEKYSSADYSEALAQANAQINSLRGELAATGAALAVAESQLPCPEVTTVQETVVQQTAVLPTVRFKINSAYVSSEEMVNVYTVAEYLKANPETSIVVRGYADKDTGSSTYNMKLSERRAQAVADILTGDYGISPSRLTIEAAGSDSQPYATNDWNRIVIFAMPQ